MTEYKWDIIWKPVGKPNEKHPFGPMDYRGRGPIVLLMRTRYEHIHINDICWVKQGYWVYDQQQWIEAEVPDLSPGLYPPSIYPNWWAELPVLDRAMLEPRPDK